MKGIEVIEALKRKFDLYSDKQLGAQLGISTVAIHNWKKRKSCTWRQVAGLVYSASKASATTVRQTAIRPVVEFFPIDWSDSKTGANYELFGTDDENGDPHPYYIGLRQELQQHHGVYLFYDSRGQVIYAGKAKQQSLWKEMNLAFNRERGATQKIKRVAHPERRISYKTSDEKSRQINDEEVPLWDLASYFSAYEVTDGMINDVEALLVRGFANDLLNKRMERFARHRNQPK